MGVEGRDLIGGRRARPAVGVGRDRVLSDVHALGAVGPHGGLHLGGDRSQILTDDGHAMTV